MSAPPPSAAAPRTWSIAVTVILGLVAAITALLAVTGIAGYRAYRADQWQRLRESHEILSEQLAVGLASPLWNFDHGQLERLAESGMRDINVAAIAIRLSDDGSLVHARARDGQWRQVVATVEPAAAGGMISDERQIRFGDETIGTVKVLVTPAFLTARLDRVRLWAIALIMVLDLVLVLGLSVLLWRLVLRPLQQLERFALAVSSQQDGIGAEAGRLRFRGELESLRSSLARMIDLLNQRFNALQASERKYHALIANAPDAVLVSDLDAGMRFIEVNDSACRLFGASRERLLALGPGDLYPERSPEGRLNRELIAERVRLLETRQRVEQEAIISRLDGGGERLCELRLATLPLPGRRLVFASLVDITDRRRNESELAQHREHLEELIAARTAELEQARDRAERLGHEAEAANRAKSEFLSKMSHEIRTPLNAVLGYAQLLVRSGRLSDEDRQAAVIINRSGEHLLELINDILEMSRIEAGRTRVELEDFDLLGLLENLKDLFALPARGKGLALSVETAAGLPRRIRSDQRKLRQVLFNLLSNAVKFTAAGAVTIRAAHDAARGHLQVSVRDTGPGIPAEELPTLFQPFSQSRIGREHGQGSGLGLAICRGFAAALQGELRVDSRVGAGSEFTLDIPVDPVDAGLAGERTQSTVVGLAPGSARPRILVAEDHADSRRLLLDLFRSLGLEARPAADGAAAVAAFREWRPQLVLMDIDLPVMDGLQAAAAIRREDTGPTAVIVALTAAAFADDRKRILAGGCDEVVSKPYREGELFALLERLLGLRFARSDDGARVEAGFLADDELRRRLEAVPFASRQRLRGDLLTGDMPAALAAIASLPDAELARRLRALVDEFAVERLLALLSGPPEAERSA